MSQVVPEPRDQKVDIPVVGELWTKRRRLRGKQKDEEAGGADEEPRIGKVEGSEEQVEVSLDPEWVGVGKDWIDAMAKRQVVWSQEKDRCLELVMDDLEMGGTGEEWAKVLGRLDIQQSCEEEMVEVTREERPKAGLNSVWEQVRREMELWVPTMKKEVGALLEKTGIREVREEEVDRWEREGEAVQRAPGKAVFTRKSGDGRRKCRAVVCGNQIQEEVEGGADVYASGAEAGTPEGGGYELVGGQLGHQDGVPERPEEVGPEDPHRCKGCGAGHHVGGDEGALWAEGFTSRLGGALDDTLRRWKVDIGGGQVLVLQQALEDQAGEDHGGVYLLLRG